MGITEVIATLPINPSLPTTKTLELILTALGVILAALPIAIGLLGWLGWERIKKLIQNQVDERLVEEKAHRRAAEDGNLGLVFGHVGIATKRPFFLNWGIANVQASLKDLPKSDEQGELSDEYFRLTGINNIAYFIAHLAVLDDSCHEEHKKQAIEYADKILEKYKRSLRDGEEGDATYLRTVGFVYGKLYRILSPTDALKKIEEVERLMLETVDGAAHHPKPSTSVKECYAAIQDAKEKLKSLTA